MLWSVAKPARKEVCMRKRFSVLLLVSLITGSTAGISQTNDGQINENSNQLSRFRLSLGHVSFLSRDDTFEFRHFFFNLSFRSSGFSRTTDSFNIGWAFEPGVNGLIVSQRYTSRVNLYFTPYAKFGPEIKLSRDLFLGASLGLVLATYESGFYPLPFFGVNGFYLVELTEHASIELESGFHSTFSPTELPLLFYFTVGVSLM